MQHVQVQVGYQPSPYNDGSPVMDPWAYYSGPFHSMGPLPTPYSPMVPPPSVYHYASYDGPYSSPLGQIGAAAAAAQAAAAQAAAAAALTASTAAASSPSAPSTPTATGPQWMGIGRDGESCGGSPFQERSLDALSLLVSAAALDSPCSSVDQYYTAAAALSQAQAAMPHTPAPHHNVRPRWSRKLASPWGGHFQAPPASPASSNGGAGPGH